MRQVSSSINNQDHEIEFIIDNTRYEISIQILFIVWAYLFMAVLFLWMGVLP
jgi:hypothetical protein